MLLSVVLTSMVFVCSSNVSAMPVSPTPTPTATPSFVSFFNCIFGVKIFPGADPVGTYTVNTPALPTSGSVSGHFTELYLRGSPHILTVYLCNSSAPIFTDHAILGDHRSLMPFGSYITTTDNNGYYLINNVPFGQYIVCYSKSLGAAQAGNGYPVQSIVLTATAPTAVVDINMD